MKPQLAKLRIKLRKALIRTDKFNDKFTSYRLVFYFLVILTLWTAMLGVLGLVPFEWYQILLSALWLMIICRLTNLLLARKLDVAINTESDFITGLILALIFSPPSTLEQFGLVSLAGIVAIVSKYAINFSRKHIFNPAAFGAATVGFVFSFWPSWWVGNSFTLPLIVVGGFLIARKLKRLDLVAVFMAVYVVLTFMQLMLDSPATDTLQAVWLVLSSSSLLFFAVIMLTEPLTSPRIRSIYLLYGTLVAVLYSVSGFNLTSALLVGNLAAFVTNPNPRRIMKLIGKKEEAEGIETFTFDGKKGLKYDAGQYMEWTIPQNRTDARGNRRYLTLSSSPTETDVTFTIRVPQNNMSRFKERLEGMKPGDVILAGELAGNFTLPKSEKTKLAWLAGGVGITPFRSMAKFLTDFEQQRDIKLLYFADSPSQFAFKEVFKQAERFGLETNYLTDEKITPKVIRERITDYEERTFYISGPYGFVSAAEEYLLDMGIGPDRITTDYFPGYG